MKNKGKKGNKEINKKKVKKSLKKVNNNKTLINKGSVKQHRVECQKKV